MRNVFFLALLSLALISCASKTDVPERVMEDGVEVVLNRIEPYNKNGEPITFSLQKEFSIDTEKDLIAKLGLTDMGLYFDVDSQGNIYLVGYENTEGMIFEFDSKANFVRSFCRKGQGPGELHGRNYVSLYLTSDRNDNIAVSDYGNKLVVFDGDGQMIEERKIDPGTICITPLSNGNFLSYISVMDGTSEFINQNPLTLFNGKFEKIAELDKQMVPNPIVGKRLKGSYHVLSWSVSNGKIFTGFQERGYEVFVYELDGKLLKKIKKESKPIAITEDYKASFMEQFNAPIFDAIRSKIYFPDAMPPFHSFFTDDKGYLFVMTHETGENPGEYMYDIFNPEGTCIGRKSLKILHDESGVYAKIKNGRFYCLNEKENGYKELVVSQVIWE